MKELEQYKAKLEEWKKACEGYLELSAPGIDSDGRSFYQCNLYDKKRNETDIPIVDVSLKDWTELIDAHIKAIEALEFYASEWRSDVYYGPTEILVKDFGTLAAETLSQISRGEK